MHKYRILTIEITPWAISEAYKVFGYKWSFCFYWSGWRSCLCQTFCAFSACCIEYKPGKFARSTVFVLFFLKFTQNSVLVYWRGLSLSARLLFGMFWIWVFGWQILSQSLNSKGVGMCPIGALGCTQPVPMLFEAESKQLLMYRSSPKLLLM